MVSTNIIELMASVIAETQALLSEFSHNERAREYVERPLKATHFIRDEMNLYIAPDGSVNEDIIASGRYAAAPFATIETNLYIAKKFRENGTLSFSDTQLERLDAIAAKVKIVRDQLDEIWAIK